MEPLTLTDAQVKELLISHGVPARYARKDVSLRSEGFTEAADYMAGPHNADDSICILGSGLALRNLTALLLRAFLLKHGCPVRCWDLTLLAATCGDPASRKEFAANEIVPFSKKPRAKAFLTSMTSVTGSSDACPPAYRGWMTKTLMAAYDQGMSFVFSVDIPDTAETGPLAAKKFVNPWWGMELAEIAATAKIITTR